MFGVSLRTKIKTVWFGKVCKIQGASTESDWRKRRIAQQHEQLSQYLFPPNQRDYSTASVCVQTRPARVPHDMIGRLRHKKQTGGSRLVSPFRTQMRESVWRSKGERQIKNDELHVCCCVHTLLLHLRHCGLLFGWQRPATNQSACRPNSTL